MWKRSKRPLVRHCLNCSTLSRSLPLTPIDVCSSKPGGLSEVEDDEDEDEWVDDAEEQAADPDCDRFLFINLVMNNAAASISSLILQIVLCQFLNT